MNKILNFLRDNQPDFLHSLGELVAIESVSTDDSHAEQLKQAAQWTARALEKAGYANIRLFPNGTSADLVYGERIVDRRLPTVLGYAHYDKQPADEQGWTASRPFVLDVRDGKAFGRGSQDDGAGLVAQLAVSQAYSAVGETPPLNLKILVEGQEEIGSPSLVPFIEEHKELLAANAILVADTENAVDSTTLATVPALTYALRGCLWIELTVRSARFPSHSGTTGGGLADPALAKAVILSRLLKKRGRYRIPHFYDQVKKLSRREDRMLQLSETPIRALREKFGVLDGVRLDAPDQRWERTTTAEPSITVISEKTGFWDHPSNQVLDQSSALISVRLVPDQSPSETLEQIRNVLTADPPGGVEVTVCERGNSAPAWKIEPNGEMFRAAMSALSKGYSVPARFIACGGTIGYVGPASQILGAAPLLFGLSGGNIHSHNEFLELDDWRKLQESIFWFYESFRQPR